MKNISLPFLFLALLVCFAACKKESKSTLKELDLMAHGVPLTIMAPDSAVISTDDIAGMKEVTVKGKDNFGVKIWVNPATTTALDSLKAQQIAEVKTNPYFSEIVKEDANGFIFKTVVDSTNVSYDFCYLVVKGDSEYRFQGDYIGTFSKEDAEWIYNAIQPKKK